jgi:hypothetical protein
LSFSRSRRASQDSNVSPSFATPASGVGHDVDPVTEVRGTDGGSRYAVPLRVIPERGQVPEYVSEPSVSPKEPWDVLHEHEAGS